jgi:hypothetical protein
MTIDEAVATLSKHLGEPDVFYIRHNGTAIIVDVVFIYRMEDVDRLHGVWQGFPIQVGRRSCW